MFSVHIPDFGKDSIPICLLPGKQMGIESLPEYEKTKCRELVTKKKLFHFNIFFCAPQRHSLTVPGIPQQFQPVGENLLTIISQILTRMVRIWGIVSKFSDHLRSDLRSQKKIPKIPQNVFSSKTNLIMTLEHRQVTKHRVTCLSPYHEIAESTFVF